MPGSELKFNIRPGLPLRTLIEQHPSSTSKVKVPKCQDKLKWGFFLRIFLLIGKFLIKRPSNKKFRRRKLDIIDVLKWQAKQNVKYPIIMENPITKYSGWMKIPNPVNYFHSLKDSDFLEEY